MSHTSASIDGCRRHLAGRHGPWSSCISASEHPNGGLDGLAPAGTKQQRGAEPGLATGRGMAMSWRARVRGTPASGGGRRMSRGRRRELGGVDRLPSGRWRVRVVDPATHRRVSIGTFTAKAEAELAFARAASDQQRGAWILPDEGRATLAEYAPTWLDSRLTSRGEPLRPRVTGSLRGAPAPPHPSCPRCSTARAADDCRRAALVRRAPGGWPRSIDSRKVLPVAPPSSTQPWRTTTSRRTHARSRVRVWSLVRSARSPRLQRSTRWPTRSRRGIERWCCSQPSVDCDAGSCSVSRGATSTCCTVR